MIVLQALTVGVHWGVLQDEDLTLQGLLGDAFLLLFHRHAGHPLHIIITIIIIIIIITSTDSYTRSPLV